MTRSLKRTTDLLLSVGALVCLSPLLGLIALSIRIESRGRAVFSQRRVGRGRREFRIMKFRTMIDRDPDQIDQHSEVVVSGGVDPRITRVGRLLRAASLDELPQLWNILRGDMSIVGPRPIIPEQMEVVPPEYLCRFEVRPGLTGLAQVRGRRSLSWLEQLAADAEYVRKRTFLIDLKLILLTFYVVLARKGIYGGEGQNWRAYRDELRAAKNEAGSP
jgi:lipopolysaccharide/colanic/teichoic acid biosynthesis glycosyltransferase